MMQMNAYALICLAFLAAQSVNFNPDAPKPGVAAPPLTVTKLMQAPAGASVDWSSLRGKVVVLEFWATWCVPCQAEIPILNSLADSTDPAKVQFIAVDDEDPALIEAFLKVRSISGWIATDTSGHLYKDYGVESRPTTIIVDTAGHIVTTTVRPEQIKREQLLAIAEGQPVTFDAPVDPATKARLEAATKEAMAAAHTASANTFEISLGPGKAGADPHTMLGNDQIDITNAPLRALLHFGLGVSSPRIEAPKSDAVYNLHVVAPGADSKQLASAVELAISAGANVRITHRTQPEDVLLLTTLPDAAKLLKPDTSASGGIALYNSKSQNLKMIFASTTQLAGSLEEAIGTPVINETAISGAVSATLKIPPKDGAAAKAELEKVLGLTLVPGRRPVERLVVENRPN